MSKTFNKRDFLSKYFLTLLLLGFISLGAIGGCNNNNATAQGDDEIQLDFLVDVVSGSMEENPDGEGFILSLEVSPNTVFIEESPGSETGTINTRDFLESFDAIFGDELPNAILTFRDGDSSAIAVPVKLISVEVDTELAMADFVVTPLDEITPANTSGTPVELIGISEASMLGPASLFIDSSKLIPHNFPLPDPPESS